MKDQQIAATSTEPRIFLVSPVLHCVSMTSLVYLRSSFGFGYLRPKSIFFAFSWAFVLFAIYAWLDANAWREYRAALRFGIGATVLYWLHLATAFRREWSEAAAHDNFSGVSHLERLPRRPKNFEHAVGEERIRLWGEPLITIAVALFIHVAFQERHLSQWLTLTGFCLWIKEALNRWFRIRRSKRCRDILEDAEDDFEGQSPAHSPMHQMPKESARKEKIKRTRAPSSSSEEATREKHYAEILRLLPPYNLAAAEDNYHALIKANHPDANGGSDDSAKYARQLNEAVAYFRGALS